ncbi:MAG: glutamyl-tRNA reductase [Planctomycetota bacterium]|jgi:glutamyl-tRNA reductase
MKDFVVVGLSHKTAPVALRERFKVEDLKAALDELGQVAAEVALLETCNRFELYLHDADTGRIHSWLAARVGVELEELEEHLYTRSGRNACKHLFFVASSLDSLVIGETQIRGQVKQSYQACVDHGSVGPMLHRLFQAALRVSKEISDSTGVGRGNVSVAAAAAELATRVFGGLEDKRVLVVGAGETAELAITHLQARGVTWFKVLNRTPENAEALARPVNGEWGGLDALPDSLSGADVIVCAAGADEPLINAKTMRKALRRRRGRPVVAIDIAVPRGIDPGVDKLDNVYRYDMDALEAVTQDALRHRRAEFVQCCTLVDGAALRLASEARARRAGDAITELEKSYDGVAREELDRLEQRLPELTEDDRQHVRESVRRIVRKLLHMPKRALREGHPDEQDVIRRVFASERRPGEE